jgi:murein DD-endopeptidase MepM/ murein hydrolase activator NlpD
MVGLVVMSCQLTSSFQGDADVTPTSIVGQASPLETVTEPAPDTPAPTNVPPAQAPVNPTEAPPSPELPAAESFGCVEEVCIKTGTFLLKRPIGAGGRVTVDPSDRYGEYQRATRSANPGGSFLNSTGTPVVAAADGSVIVAGDDSQEAYGLRRNLYGNLVILQHTLPGMNETVYTLYTHLSEVLVEEGQSVSAGQEIGKVGMSGNVSGSTLHFEVRLGENNVEAARNPELWLEVLPDEKSQPMGALAGRILDADGKYIDMGNIVLEQLAGPGQPALEQYYIGTYTDRDLRGQPPWEESFAIGDLPAGEYQVTFWLGSAQQKIVEVQPGKLTVVTFEVK